MNNVIKKTILIISATLVVAIIAYFIAGKYGFFAKKNVIYTQPITELEKANEKDAQIIIEQPSEMNEQRADSEPQIPAAEQETTVKEKVDTAQISQAIDKPDGSADEKEQQNETSSSSSKIIDKLVSWGFAKSDNRKIDTIIVHTSYDAIGNDPYSVDGIIAIYKEYNVSAHYLIGRNGNIYRLVADKDIAWHAGASEMPDGRTNINDFSIGIEVVNTKDGKFTADQYASLNRLIDQLKEKYPVKNVLGHEDIAPGRKTDPWGIEWGKVRK